MVWASWVVGGVAAGLLRVQTWKEHCKLIGHDIMPPGVCCWGIGVGCLQKAWHELGVLLVLLGLRQPCDLEHWPFGWDCV